MSVPPIPGWDGLHPLIVHFPIALLLTAPLFIVWGLVRSRTGRPFLATALVLMVLGTVATWVAVNTGEAAGELATRTPAINATLEQHEELAEQTRVVFTALTLVFAALLFVQIKMGRKLHPRFALAVGALFLVGYLGGAGLLANTAHQGGRLVHEHGVRAFMAAPRMNSVAAGMDAEGADKDDD